MRVRGVGGDTYPFLLFVVGGSGGALLQWRGRGQRVHVRVRREPVIQEALVVIRARRRPLRGHCNQHLSSLELLERERGRERTLGGRGSQGAGDGRCGGCNASVAYVVGRVRRERRAALTYQPPRLLQRAVHAVHLVVQPARVA